ncbi:ATP-grasp domain-containing protein [Boeremia exigua]|uniref:ATP-grasp domain-containing protein n=1 Tax=Boeremia exigua TaxID=749465 RepID=UPI001E8D5775|nr:ATP-grasp domain-containing protein [Boeremia exigua]KAH6642802.1 ATP-grasp domain-containing protein [Boeremia exigua]
MSCLIVLQSVDGSEASWKASWTVPPVTNADQSFQSADVLFLRLSAPANFTSTERPLRCYIEDANRGRRELQATTLGHPCALDFLVDTLNATTRSTSSTESNAGQTAIKLVAPAHAGNIGRADIVRQRMQDIDYVEAVATLAQPLQQYDGRPFPDTDDLVTLIKHSAGAIRLRVNALSSSGWLLDTLSVLESELTNRLPTLLTVPGLRRRTLAFLEGSGFLPDTGGCARQFYTAAISLGVDVIVLGVEGHWLQGPEYSHWRKAFIPIEFGHDAAFPSRIVAAVKRSGEPVEALLTTFDSYHAAVSEAAAELGLPHEPTAAYQVATDKYQLSAIEGRKCFLATGIEDLIQTALTKDVTWPAIVKPCRGWGSELVFRADNATQLVTWARTINLATSHGTQFVIEPYCDGPEVDINFVLYNGELLFWEIGDENPKSAEDGSDSFHELDCVSPSALPQTEQHILRDSIVKTLLGLGFENGIYHCEARVADSTQEWHNNESGAPVLLPRCEPATKPPSCFLMDCNIRPPGLNSSDVVETTWGVDYWALLIAIPLREEQRVRTLSQPYRNGPQYFADMIFVSAEFDASKKGIWQSGNITEELKERRPDLAKYISKALTYMKKGDKIPHHSTGTNTFVAYLNIFSRESRGHVLDIATQVRKEITESIEIS